MCLFVRPPINDLPSQLGSMPIVVSKSRPPRRYPAQLGASTDSSLGRY